MIDDLVLEASLYEDHLSIDEFDFGNEKDYVQLHEEEAESWMEEHIHVNVPIQSFLDQMVSVNMILATKGEADREFGEYLAMNFYSGYSHQIGQNNALMWLISQYGKTDPFLSALAEASDPEENGAQYANASDPFIASVIQELEENSYCMGALIFCLEMPLRDLISLRLMQEGKDRKKIMLKKDVMCGIYNPWIGCGSVLEIELPDDVIVPADMVWSVWIEGTKMHGYDPGEVYGLCKSAWKPNYRLIDNPEELTV